MTCMLRWALPGLLAAATAQAMPGEQWASAWWSAQMPLEGANALPTAEMSDATLRQLVRLQVPAERLRVRFSNRFGTTPLKIDAASIALASDPASARIEPASLRRLRFGGRAAVEIPAGADYWSDPVAVQVPAGGDLAVSIHFVQPLVRQTGHFDSRATSYFVRGDHSGDTDLTDARKIEHWYQLTGIEVMAPAGRAIVAFGDSITDGHGIQTDSNRRWTDALQERMRHAPGLARVAVLNAGIGGNRLLQDGTGQNALARFDEEVLTPPGVRHVIVLEGVNDIGKFNLNTSATPEAHHELVEQMIGAYRQMIARAHAHGIKMIGATIMPYSASVYYHPDAQKEADRQAVNRWIRTPGNFDAVIDFDVAMRDSADPTRLRKEYDSGDGIHPSEGGYAAMAAAVPLGLLR